MRRPVLRALMVLVGLATLTVYLLVAFGAYLLVRLVWELQPSPEAVAVYLLALTLAFAYLSYQLGTARILRQLRVQSLPPERAPWRRVPVRRDGSRSGDRPGSDRVLRFPRRIGRSVRAGPVPSPKILYSPRVTFYPA